MATKQEKFDSVYSQVLNAQNDHIKNHKRYWQGIAVPTDIPTTGDNPTIDETVKPDDESESWADKGIALPEPCDIQFKVDQWRDSKGNVGWTLVAKYYTLNGQLKRKTKNHKENESSWVSVKNSDDPLA